MSQSFDPRQRPRRAEVSTSILFDTSYGGNRVLEEKQPALFADLNLDQIVGSVTAGRDEYHLNSVFYTPLAHVDAINYRHEVFQDLVNPELSAVMGQFAAAMRKMREHLAQADKLHYKYQRQSWFLEAADIYRRNIGELARSLSTVKVHSRGFVSFREYLNRYSRSESFTSFATETQKIRSNLAATKYSFYIEGSRIEVHRFASESDYGAEILQAFAKFREGVGKEYRFEFPASFDMNHIEAEVLDRVAKLYPDVFFSLDEYCTQRREFVDPVVGAFDCEVQFYLAYIEHVRRLEADGLSFCYPTVRTDSKEISGGETFDLALANQVIHEKGAVVTNDFYLRGAERIFVVSGPNQGGKTTFARAFGQMHYLASLGCPVPGKEASVLLFDKMFTHFESEEDIHNLRGKLEDDLIRIHQILEEATSRSILIMNESFASTTVDDALFLSKKIMEQIIQRDMLGVSVTFLDELASLDKATVSMVSTVDSDNHAVRTFKVIRKPADGLAYAQTLAEKYSLTYEDIKRRVAS